jgi:hypothetical protein
LDEHNRPSLADATRSSRRIVLRRAARASFHPICLPGCRNCRGRQVDGSRAAALGAGNAAGVAFFDTSQPIVLGNPDVFQMNIISAIARRNDNRPDNIAAVQWRVNYAKSKTRFRGNL